MAMAEGWTGAFAAVFPAPIRFARCGEVDLLPSGDRRGLVLCAGHAGGLRRGAERAVVLPPPFLGMRHARPRSLSRGGAAGVRGTGIGCYFDDEMHCLLGIDGHSW